MNFERRGRSLSINELVAGTLIHYPTYISEKSKMYTTPEIVSEELIARRNNAIKKISFGRKVFWNLIKLWNNYKKM
jgi:capsular polysaccharide export protein